MDGIYSATYSGVSALNLCHCHLLNAYYFTYNQVPVFEFNVESNHVMRRRHDHYINATHILKVADYDKPARTRILEREVQKGVHEKIQGGYGKYQGQQRFGPRMMFAGAKVPRYLGSLKRWQDSGRTEWCPRQTPAHL